MRALRAIVAALALDVPRREAEIAEGGAIGAQPVGDDHGWCGALPFQQLEHQPARRPGVTPGLNEHVEDLAFGL